MKRPTILLVNPYIYDFAAYDLWIKPLGLLYIAAVLEEAGAEVVLLDGLDRWHPDVLARAGRSEPKSRPFGDGFFHKEQVDKPEMFLDVPRNYYRYGMPPEVMRTNLEVIRGRKPIDAVLVTSGMTYWYRGVHEAIALAREVFGPVPILLGGIYATLYPQFAKERSGADLVISGEGERTIVPALSRWLDGLSARTYRGYDEYPLPAYHLYPKLDYVSMMTSRGCPYACSFCATHEFTRHFSRRHPSFVIQEIDHYVHRMDVRNISFYDDALFVDADRHIKPILRHVIARGWQVNFHTPNGLFARLLDPELAQLLVQSGFRTIRLSFETTDPVRQRQMRKVTDSDLSRALRNLEHAGFPRSDVTVYLIMGLPGQQPREVEDSIRYVHDLGARVSLSSFSPIPNTTDWTKAVRDFDFPVDEPLMTNKSIYPLKNPLFTGEDFDRLKAMGIAANRSLPSAADADPVVSDYNAYA